MCRATSVMARDVYKRQPLTHEEELEKELEKAQEEIEEQKDKYLRLSAEFDNYRKQMCIRDSSECHPTTGNFSLSSCKQVYPGLHSVPASQVADDTSPPHQPFSGLYDLSLIHISSVAFVTCNSPDR